MKRRARGFTLVELVIAIVILSTIGVTIAGLLAFIGRTSAQGLSQTQSAVMANAYLQSVLGEEFSGTTDNITPYDGQNYTGLRDRYNNPIPGLQNYRVAISVINITLGSGANSIPAKSVTVTITDPMGDLVRLNGIRTQR